MKIRNISRSRFLDLLLVTVFAIVIVVGIVIGRISDGRAGNDIIRDERRACLARGDDWAQHPGNPQDDYCIIRGGGR